MDGQEIQVLVFGRSLSLRVMVVPAAWNDTNCSIPDLCLNGGTCVLLPNSTSVPTLHNPELLVLATASVVNTDTGSVGESYGNETTFCECLTGYSGVACADGEVAHTFFTVFEILSLIYLYLGLAVLVRVTDDGDGD